MTALAALLAGAVLAAITVIDHRQSLDHAQHTTVEFARLLDEHTSRVIEASDMAVQRAIEMVQTQGLARVGRSREDWSRLRDMADRLPQVKALWIIDQNGRPVLSSSSFPAPDVTARDREYFKVIRDGRDLHVGLPVEAKRGGAAVLPLARRLEGPNGEFRGMVVAAIDLTYFERFYRTLDFGSTTALSLFSTDARLLIRQPLDGLQLGRDMSGSPLFEQYLPRSPTGSFIGVSTLDGRQRITSYRRLLDWPVVVVASVGVDEVMGPWRRRLVMNGFFAVLAVGLIAGLGALAARALGREKHTLRLLEKTADQLAVLNRRQRMILSSAGEGIFEIDVTGRVSFANAAALRLTGFAVHDFLGLDAHGLIRHSYPDGSPHPRDRCAIQQTLLDRRELRATDEVFWRKDGSCFPVEYVATPVIEDDDVAGVVVVFRDISERVAAAIELSAANERLAALAFADGLTALANRRHLENRIEIEWQTAMRLGQPVSLVMLDVDHFKRFNDRYGHLAGDDALRRVADAMRQAVKRPADVAARYGGEEFAILMPNTDEAGARIVAELVAAGLRDQGIPHQDNAPAQVLTASMGVATLRPAPGDNPTQLKALADQRLYAAKHAGRNRIESGVTGVLGVAAQ